MWLGFCVQIPLCGHRLNSPALQ
uniref:Uncharacterized protein n=1 Tax=Anguilla anguilla TaxID=7936 RepID=A0A0E9RM14_ANGAN